MALFAASLLAAPGHTQEIQRCSNPKGWQPTPQELQQILGNHDDWFWNGGPNNPAIPGKANLCNADLFRADLQGAVLLDVNLSGANLLEANMNGVKLGGANLREADLSRADLSGSNLKRVNLQGAKLSWSVLRGSNLSGADLEGAELIKAKLSGASLIGANLSNADLSGVDLRGADVSEANLTEVNLGEANLSQADLFKSDLSRARLFNANLSEADLAGANLSETDLSGANLSKADLRAAQLTMASLFWTDLEDAKIGGVDLTDARYEPVSAPAKGNLSGLRGLTTVKFGPGNHSGLALLRKALEDAGLRGLEREATFALESWRTRYALAGIGDNAEYDDEGKLTKKDLGAMFEGALKLIFFEWPTGWGLFYGRPIKLMLSLIAIMTLIYMPVLAMPVRTGRGSGIFRIWPKGRIEENGESFQTADDEKIERLNVKGFATLGYAFYFSVLSAFHVGWRDLNVGSWIARVQLHEYVLRAKGWVRVASGLQSLASVYLLAMWALTYFGRPFQ